MRIKIISGLFLFIAVVSALYFFAGWRDIELGEVGIRITMIGPNKGETIALGPGTRYVDPILYDLDTYSTLFAQYMLEGDEAVVSQTEDGQPVLVEASFQIGLVEQQVPWLAANVGRNWYEEVFYPAARRTIRDSVATESSDTVYTGEGRVRIGQLIQSRMSEELDGYGIRFETNLRDISFQNQDFVTVLEQKAAAAQQIEIERRNALAAEQAALKVQNTAQGERFRVEQEAQATREKLRLEGEGQQLRDEAIAAGNLALAQADAEGTRLRREALAGRGGPELVSIEWARNLGPNVKVYGVPTGAEGTQTFLFDEALRGFAGSAAVAASQGGN